MATETDTTSSTSTAPADAIAVDAPATVVPAREPGSAASEAGRTLAAIRADRMAKLREPAKDAPATAATPPVTSAAPADDTDVAALIREDRRIKAAEKAVAAERAALAAERAKVGDFAPRVEAARTALAAGNKLAAIKALFPGEDLTSDLFWDLAKETGEQVSGESGQVDVAKLVADRVAAELDARKAADAAEAARKAAEQAQGRDAELSDARSLYLDDANKAYAPGKFPGIDRLHRALAVDDSNDASDVLGQRLMRFVEAEGKKAGRIMSPAEALVAFDKRLTGGDAPAEVVTPPSPTITQGWRSDAGRPAAADPGYRSLDQIREERRARLRGTG